MEGQPDETITRARPRRGGKVEDKGDGHVGEAAKLLGACGWRGSITWTCQATGTPSRGAVRAWLRRGSVWSMGSYDHQGINPSGLHGHHGKASGGRSWSLGGLGCEDEA
jgi:hypothetical protein